MSRTKHKLVEPIHLTAQIDAARARHDQAAMVMAALLESNCNGQFWAETQELEAASLELGKLLNEAKG